MKTFISTAALLRLILRAGLFSVVFVLALCVCVVSQFGGNASFPADCAIVFGAALHGGPVDDANPIAVSGAGPGILRRMDTAVNLYRRSLIHTVFLTGGRGEGMGLSEAQVMQQIARKAGIDPEDIVIEDASHSTMENLRNTRPLTSKCGSIVAISDRYHLARIRWLAWMMGWSDLQTYPADEHAPLFFELSSILRETGGLLYSLIYPFEVN